MGELHAPLQELESLAAAEQTLPPVFGRKSIINWCKSGWGWPAAFSPRCNANMPPPRGIPCVALTCSAWSLQMGFPHRQRDVIEVAALLHDIGVIEAAGQHSAETRQSRRGRGGPDEPRPPRRRGNPQAQLHLARSMSIVEHVSAWYDGRTREFGLRGSRSRSARMIALVEAYDSMTTDHVFRPARSQEFALGELFHFSGTQFDPELVKRFAEFQRDESGPLHREVAGRWLRTLDPNLVNSYWELNNVPSQPTGEKNGSLFEAKLLENMYDAVVFFDSAGRIASGIAARNG